MRALMYDHYGDETVLQLREVPVPQPGLGEVQVQVLVASINPVDYKLRGGMMKLLGKPSLPATTGKDFAGRVTQLGAGASGFTVDQRIFGSQDPMQGRGVCAQTIVITPDRLCATPTASATKPLLAWAWPVARRFRRWTCWLA